MMIERTRRTPAAREAALARALAEREEAVRAHKLAFEAWEDANRKLGDQIARYNGWCGIDIDYAAGTEELATLRLQAAHSSLTAAEISVQAARFLLDRTGLKSSP